MKVCLICSSGGHQVEMAKICSAFQGIDFFLITHNYEFSNLGDCLNKRKIYFIENLLVGRANLNPIFKYILYILYMSIVAVNGFKIMLLENPDILISTGSAIAIPLFLIGKLYGKKLIYVESVCRVKDISKAGKLLYPICDLFLVQWAQLKEKYKKSEYKGNVLRKPGETIGDSHGNFIFVTVGTAPFLRLIKGIDGIIGESQLKILMQIGKTNYKPKNADYFTFKENMEDIEELYRKARLVITHGGAGSIITALEQNSDIVVVPRLMKFGEAYDNHQLELAEELERRGLLNIVYDVDTLSKFLDIGWCQSNRKLCDVYDNQALTEFLKEYLDNQASKP